MLETFVKNTQNLSNKDIKTLDLLINQKCTVPFIARYRKETTGNIDEVAIRDLEKNYNTFVEITKRKGFILETLKKRELLTKELEYSLNRAADLTTLEDIYAPFKSKRKTKASIAKDAGLLPLAQTILNGLSDIKISQNEFKSTDKIKTWEEALGGAKDIIIEEMSHHIDAKQELRELYWKDAKLITTKKKGAEDQKDYLKYKDYFEFESDISTLKQAKASHRFLGIRRGVTENVLKTEIKIDKNHASAIIKNYFFKNSKIKNQEIFKECADRAFSVYIHSSLDLEIKSELKKLADEAAIDVFGINLKNLLLSPILGHVPIMGIDPGVRTGCKIVLIDKTGKFILDFVIYPHPPKNDIKGSAEKITKVLEEFSIKHIAIGNGTYGRETLEFLKDNVESIKNSKVSATLTSESGASIYSASDIAREEFPDKDLTVRGSISIARRFQDPLAELVKIDPKSIGVGQYQHDLNQANLKKNLGVVVESCVNYVGVNINTASAPLLSFVSGIGPSLAKNIVGHREKNGEFKDRRELLKISRFTNKNFEQSAGFLRIYNGKNPLDATFIHPEQYPILENWAKKHNCDIIKSINNLETDSDLCNKIGEHTFKDIIKSLKAPSQDPRTMFKSTSFKKGLRSLNDVEIGIWYNGIVTNITQFGAFIDIGIKENGLVHISELSDEFVKNALDVVKVGQEIKVKALSVDKQRKRLALSCKTGKKREAPITKQKVQKKSEPSKKSFSGLKNFKIK